LVQWSTTLRPIDFDEFHRVDLPAACQAWPIFTDATGRAPLASAGRGRSYTYEPTDDGHHSIVPGDDAAPRGELSYEDWCLRLGVRTCFALFYAEADLSPVLASWPLGTVAGVAFDGQSVYDSTTPRRARRTATVDLTRSYLDDDDAPAISAPGGFSPAWRRGDDELEHYGPSHHA